MSEAQHLAKRLALRERLRDNPQASVRTLALDLGLGESTIRKWRSRILAALDDPATCYSHSRAKKTPSTPYPEPVIARILEVRDHPPGQLNRVPGPKTILYYLRMDPTLSGLRQPRSPSTVHRLLRQYQRIVDPPPHTHTPVALPPPFDHWQMDFKDPASVPPAEHGKRQHVVEIFNVVDVGTSISVYTKARNDFQMTTVIETVAELVQQHGLPKRIQMDRDPRFVGGTQHPNLPSPLAQFFLCQGVEVIINPPRRPQANGHVERYHKSLKYECLRVKHPTTLAEVQEAATTFQQWYNEQRPHQGRSCNNQPPKVAHPTLPPLPSPPLVIDPDRWVDTLDGKTYVRRVQQNGTIVLYGWVYSLGQALRGQEVTVQIEAGLRELVVHSTQAVLRRFPLKGLVRKVLTFAEFVAHLSELARQGDLRARQDAGARQGSALPRHTPLQPQTPLQTKTPLQRRTALQQKTALQRRTTLRQKTPLRAKRSLQAYRLHRQRAGRKQPLQESG